MTRMDARACRSLIPDPSRAHQVIHTNPRQLKDTEAPHLVAYLAGVPDSRAARGRRHPFVAILALAAAAVLAGARSIAAIAEWAADTPQPVRVALGARHHTPGCFAVPAEATIRRTLARLDADVLADAIGAWLAGRRGHDRGDGAGPDRRQGPRQRAVAVDGKTLRGARAPDGGGRPVHPAGLYGPRHPRGAGPTPGWRRSRGGPRVPAAAGRGSTWPGRWSPPTPSTPILTRPSSWSPVNRPLPVSGQGQPAPHPAGPVPAPARHRVPVLDATRDRGHCRIKHPILKAVTVHRFGFPHTAQVLQITRKTRALRTRRWQTMTVYAVTSLTHAQARPTRLADLIRGHWAIEALPHVCDVTFAEDTSEVRTSAGPTVMACLRNLVIGALNQAGPVNLAAALACTPVAHADPWPPSGSDLDKPDITTARRGAGRPPESRFCFS